MKPFRLIPTGVARAFPQLGVLPAVVMANLGQVLKKQVSGFDFKKPGYPGWVLGFQNCTNFANVD